MDIDLYFGRRYQINYKIGDVYEWLARKTPEKGGRPEAGSIDGEGYTECPSCTKDFFVLVEVRNDVIEAVKPDPTKKPHIPD